MAVNYMHSKAEAESLVAEITRLGGRAAAYQADVADYAAVGRMIDQIVAELGRLDVVVNNAGYVEAKLFLETTPDEWKRQVDVDLYGVFNVCHAAAPKLAAQKGGRIISIVGDSARVGQQRLGVSAGARGAVLSLTRTLAKELGRQNITVNSLALGWIETSHSDKEFIAKNRERILAFYPIRRLGKPEDVGAARGLPASDLAGWVTGQTISVSGGYSTV